MPNPPESPVSTDRAKSPCFETAGRPLHENLAPLLEWVSPGVLRAAAWTVLFDVIAFARAGGYAIPTIGEWQRRWLASDQAYAMMQPDEYEKLKHLEVPMVELGRDPRRVVVSRR